MRTRGGGWCARGSAVTALCLGWLAASVSAAESPSETPAERGYRLLTTKAYLAPDFDQEVFDQLWMTWEEPLRSQAEAASAEERRRMAFSRYGLTEALGRAGPVALQYVDDGRGGWVISCLACHAGKVAGQVIPGLPNSLFALETLTEEVRETKLRLEKPLVRMDLASLGMPLGGSNGTTNAVMFGVLLMSYRDADLNVHRDRPQPEMAHHDHDAPPFWNVKRKKNLYIDGFAPRGHRPLMQFLLEPRNGPERFRQWEDEFRDVEAWIESLSAPRYPWPVDTGLAAAGEAAFNRVCADCHGTYGPNGHYPERLVPIDEVGTDRVRLDALTPAGRSHYGESWFTHYGEHPVIADPGGYVAPPLDGVWASAPYFHNGSVPTLWHVLHPEKRPTVWLRTEDGYDRERGGLEVAEHERIPPGQLSLKARRRFFDTRRRGKSASGHDFPDVLGPEEKRAVLEYLKTL